MRPFTSLFEATFGAYPDVRTPLPAELAAERDDPPLAYLYLVLQTAAKASEVVALQDRRRRLCEEVMGLLLESRHLEIITATLQLVPSLPQFRHQLGPILTIAMDVGVSVETLEELVARMQHEATQALLQLGTATQGPIVSKLLSKSLRLPGGIILFAALLQDVFPGQIRHVLVERVRAEPFSAMVSQVVDILSFARQGKDDFSQTELMAADVCLEVVGLDLVRYVLHLASTIRHVAQQLSFSADNAEIERMGGMGDDPVAMEETVLQYVSCLRYVVESVKPSLFPVGQGEGHVLATLFSALMAYLPFAEPQSRTWIDSIATAYLLCQFPQWEVSDDQPVPILRVVPLPPQGLGQDEDGGCTLELSLDCPLDALHTYKRLLDPRDDESVIPLPDEADFFLLCLRFTRIPGISHVAIDLARQLVLEYPHSIRYLFKDIPCLILATTIVFPTFQQETERTFLAVNSVLSELLREIIEMTEIAISDPHSSNNHCIELLVGAAEVLKLSTLTFFDHLFQSKHLFPRFLHLVASGRMETGGSGASSRLFIESKRIQAAVAGLLTGQPAAILDAGLQRSEEEERVVKMIRQGSPTKVIGASALRPPQSLRNFVAIIGLDRFQTMVGDFHVHR